MRRRLFHSRGIFRDRSLFRERSGVTSIEFALIAPIVISLMMGVVEFGISMWSYNAMRSVAVDVSRYATINYTSGNKLTNDQLTAYTRARAIDSPYSLVSSQLNVSITDATAQQISGARQMNLSLFYQVPSMLQMVGLPDLRLSYTRPIYVTTS
ncbi:MAG: TadE/TadG family type IV pilus assembly protein [Novosphingobium sp.]